MTKYLILASLVFVWACDNLPELNQDPQSSHLNELPDLDPAVGDLRYRFRTGSDVTASTLEANLHFGQIWNCRLLSAYAGATTTATILFRFSKSLDPDLTYLEISNTTASELGRVPPFQFLNGHYTLEESKEENGCGDIFRTVLRVNSAEPNTWFYEVGNRVEFGNCRFPYDQVAPVLNSSEGFHAAGYARCTL